MAGLALLTRLTPSSGYATVVLLAELLVGLGIECVFTSSITSGVDPRQVGIAAATANTAMQIGSSVPDSGHLGLPRPYEHTPTVAKVAALHRSPNPRLLRPQRSI